MFLPIPAENQPGLIAELEADPFVRLALSSATCELYHRYGMFLAPLTAALTTIKHCQFGHRDFPWSSRRQSCSSTCIGPSRSRWRPSFGALYSSGCMAPSKGFGQTGGREGLWSDACPESCIAGDSDSEAHSGPCYGGLGPASQPLSAPPQRPGGCADTLTSIFSKPPCALVTADMHCSRCVGLLGTPGLPRVKSPLDRLLDDL